MLGMVSVVADAKDNDVQGAFAILSVLGDDNKYKKRLEELQTLAQQASEDKRKAEADKTEAETLTAHANQVLLDASAIDSEARSIRKAAEASIAAAEAAVAGREKVLAEAKKQFASEMADREDDFKDTVSRSTIEYNAKQHELVAEAATQEMKFAARQKELDQNEAAVALRETAVTEAEKKAKDFADQLAKQAVELKLKFEQLRSIVG